MSNTQRIFMELSKDLGFEMRDGHIVAVIGGSDRHHMHQDIKNIGNDMRAVISRTNG